MYIGDFPPKDEGYNPFKIPKDFNPFIYREGVPTIVNNIIPTRRVTMTVLGNALKGRALEVYFGGHTYTFTGVSEQLENYIKFTKEIGAYPEDGVKLIQYLIGLGLVLKGMR